MLSQAPREVGRDADVCAGSQGGGDEVDAPRRRLLFLLGGLGRWISGRGGGGGRYRGGGGLARLWREGGAGNFGDPEGGGEAHLICRLAGDGRTSSPGEGDASMDEIYEMETWSIGLLINGPPRVVVHGP